MTRDAEVRRETWTKAIVAARKPLGFTLTLQNAYAVELVVAEIVRAAEADGVTFDEAPPP